MKQFLSAQWYDRSAGNRNGNGNSDEIVPLSTPTSLLLIPPYLVAFWSKSVFLRSEMCLKNCSPASHPFAGTCIVWVRGFWGNFKQSLYWSLSLTAKCMGRLRGLSGNFKPSIRLPYSLAETYVSRVVGLLGFFFLKSPSIYPIAAQSLFRIRSLLVL